MSITIDGTAYAVNVVECKRTVNTLDRFAERTQDGVLHRELIGVYINYVVTLGKPTNSADVTAYANFWNAISQAVENHDVVMPDGYSFTAYIGDGASDSIRRIHNATVFWENLSVAFIAVEPEATP